MSVDDDDGVVVFWGGGKQMKKHFSWDFMYKQGCMFVYVYIDRNEAAQPDSGSAYNTHTRHLYICYNFI